MNLRNGLIVLLASVAFLSVSQCEESGDLTVVGAMYHNWWVESRWSDNPPNHPYEPVLGHYDSADPDVIRQHIAWSRAAGINTWVIDFWITDRDQWWVDPNTQAVADICDQEGMNYFFLIDGWFEFLDAADPAYEIASRVNALAAPYFNRPGYLHADGKPVVFFWAASWTNCTQFDAIRSGIEGTVGPVYMTGSLEGCFDLRMMYNSYTPACAANDYSCQLDHQSDIWRDYVDDGRPWAPTAIAGYNDTDVREGNPVLDLNEDFFRRSIRNALSFPQHHRDGAKWLFVCSWNEWHEGSQIEPSVDFPNPYFLIEALGDEVTTYGTSRKHPPQSPMSQLPWR